MILKRQSLQSIIPSLASSVSLTCNPVANTRFGWGKFDVKSFLRGPLLCHLGHRIYLSFIGDHQTTVLGCWRVQWGVEWIGKSVAEEMRSLTAMNNPRTTWFISPYPPRQHFSLLMREWLFLSHRTREGEEWGFELRSPRVCNAYLLCVQNAHAIILLVSRASVGSYVGHKAKEMSTCWNSLQGSRFLPFLFSFTHAPPRWPRLSRVAKNFSLRKLHSLFFQDDWAFFPGWGRSPWRSTAVECGQAGPSLQHQSQQSACGVVRCPCSLRILCTEMQPN